MSFEVVVSPDERKTALLVGEPLTEEDVASILDHGYGVNVLGAPLGATSLEFLAPLAPFLTKLIILSPQIEDARFVEEMRELRDLSIGVKTKFAVDVTKIPGLLSFGGEYRHLRYAFTHPNIRRLFLRSFPQAEVPIIFAPIEYLRINNARKLSELPVLASPETLVELRVDSARRLSIANAEHYSGLEWLLLESCREIVDIETVTRMPGLKRLTLIDCASINNIDALLSLRGMEISVGGRHPFSPEFQLAAAGSNSLWSFPPGRRCYVPPEKGAPASRPVGLYLIHPGLSRPLSVPEEASEDNPWQDFLTREWQQLSGSSRQELLAAYLGRVLAWAVGEGADRVEIPVAPYDEDDVTTVPLNNQNTEEVTRQLISASAFSVLSGDIELAKVWETVEEGIIVRSKNPGAI